MANLPPVTTNDPHPAAHNAERTEINNLNTALAGKISKPGGAATGDLLRWDGANWVTTETRFFEGVGNPNGVVAAPVGSRYVDKTGTRGAVTWDKTGGAEGNTGWTSSIGPLAINGQAGQITISGIAAKTKTRVVPLDESIFLGYAPRFVLLTSTGQYSDVAHPYLISKTANSITIGVRHVDNVTFPAATTPQVDWLAII